MVDREPVSQKKEDAPPKQKTKSTHRSVASFIFSFLVCFVTWIILSGKFDGFHLSLGVISCALVSFMTGHMLSTGRLKGIFVVWWRFIQYVPWLILQIFRANMHVMYLVFHPRMMELIDPHIVEFNSRLDSEMSRFVLANSITLTPGTITVYASIYGQFSVHAIDRPSGEGLPGEMETRVASIYDE